MNQRYNITVEIKLLVADDAPFIQEVLRFNLADSSITIVGEAYDGLEAITLAEKLNPDVILMDLVMPKMSGIEASKEILRKNQHIRIIACSTEEHETMVMQAIAAGCCNFVKKPFKNRELIEAIEKAGQAKTERSL